MFDELSKVTGTLFLKDVLGNFILNVIQILIF